MGGADGQGFDYREDLARHATEYRRDPRWKPGMGDPEAYVDGPRAVAKLWDKRQRQGWVKDPGRYERAAEGFESAAEASGAKLISEAYDEAAATGFNPEVE